MKCIHPGTLLFDGDGNRISSSRYDSLSLEGKPVYAKDVPCGKCIACRINKRREWTLRLCHEETNSTTSFFVTLTYDDAHLPVNDAGMAVVSKRDIQLFMKRLRKVCAPINIRFFLNSEYGPQTQRPHYHALIFNVPESMMLQDSKTIRRGKSVGFTSPFLMKIWQKGNVEVSPATKERAGYCAKYFIDRKDVDPFVEPNFSLMSRNPGIGADYRDAIKDKVRYYGLRACMNASGTYVALPRYYRDRIYTDEERHEMFMRSLDSEIDPEYLTMLENSELVEQNRYRALTWKGKKSKL